MPVYQVHLPYSCTLKVYGYFLSAAPNPLTPPRTRCIDGERPPQEQLSIHCQVPKACTVQYLLDGYNEVKKILVRAVRVVAFVSRP